MSNRVQMVTHRVLMPSIVDQVFGESFAVGNMMRAQFIKDVEEYKNLSNRQWHRKRKLEKDIALEAKYWIEDIKKIQNEKSQITINPRRRGKLSKVR